ncbi:MAG TPA: hypothetical protein VEZ90_03135 [Blastocatellia bacterium]|nr:hypothetical protein [Blastocatellia bacterium]
MAYSSKMRFVVGLLVLILGLLAVAVGQSTGRTTANKPIAGQPSQSISSQAETLNTIDGPVTSIDGDILEIAGAIQVDISQAGLRSMVGGESLPPGSIAVGTSIEAEVSTLSSDPAKPSRAETVFVQLPTGATLYGALQAVNLKTKTVKLLNTTVQITSQTAWPIFGGVLVLDQLRIGEPLSVSFENTGSGLVATQVRFK